jgi:oligoribonuclease NrnB/cAMP/cGMP phosphodiesterase (DHH superfamily)
LSKEFSKELPRFFAFTGQQEFVDRFMDVRRFAIERESYWTEQEKELMRLVQHANERRHASLLRKFRKRKVFWAEENREIVIGYIISGEVNNSELLHRYLTENPDVDLACQINFDHNKVSFRSNDRVDITKFAKKFGGGGHKNSGGQPMPDGMSDLVIERMGHDGR